MTEWTKEEIDREILECARYGEEDDLLTLLNAGGDVNFIDSFTGNTALHRAAANGHVGSMKILKDFNANYTVNLEGNSPAHWAAQNAKVDALNFLFANYDVDVLAKNNAGRSVLTEAFSSKDEASIEVCLSHPSASEERLMHFAKSDNNEDAKVTIDEDGDEVEDDNGDGTGAETAAGTAIASSVAIAAHAQSEEEGGVEHSFCFSITEANPPIIKARELPIAGTQKAQPLGAAGHYEDDSTGLYMWPAAILLSAWIRRLAQSSPEIFSQRRVLELGCGCGLPGLVTAVYTQAQTVVLSDLHSRTLSNARYNVAQNASVLASKAVDVRVEMMNWADLPSRDDAQPFDVIVASDLVYDRCILPLLTSAIDRQLSESGVLYYVAPITGRDGLDGLVESLAGIRVELVEQFSTPAEIYANPLVGEDADDRCVLHFYDFAAKEPHVCSVFRRVNAIRNASSNAVVDTTDVAIDVHGDKN